ncbi:hypothetical protein [Guptibacillus hwajinpoensis]|uniref:Uncharacterized protein n=1 Tax=Guptibacillus hwajinpoensis TaxID=208199 RepID=A0ABU0JVP0_9BACL|nr:hypothetical protein [Alkalihalobacillus hemicentroti]MDQ0481156.1 hypothetical protein [Alkalihalobacillus hemicentroti]
MIMIGPTKQDIKQIENKAKQEQQEALKARSVVKEATKVNSIHHS